MRIRFVLISQQPQILPINYNYHLASLIYRRIERANPSLSLFLHKPYVIKFFTFSKLMSDRRRVIKDRLRLEGETYFEFTSPKKDIISALVSGMLEKPNVKIANAYFILLEVRILKEPEIKGGETFSTLSPISVTTVEIRNDRRKTIDLYPDEPKFYENLRKNLIKKYKLLYGKEPENDELDIKVIKAKPKRIKIKNTYHRCTEMVFKARGSVELLNIGYQAGFGERNSMGFGMVKVANGRSKEAGG